MDIYSTTGHRSLSPQQVPASLMRSTIFVYAVLHVQLLSAPPNIIGNIFEVHQLLMKQSLST